MKNLGIKLSLYINYFVFAILLNSVGIVILKSQLNYGVDEVTASTLEPFKDLPIAIASLLLAAFLPRIGYKRAMLAGLAISAVACLMMYFGNTFSTAQILFLLIGVSFALIKVSVYSAIGLVTNNEREHNSLMSSIEGFFMIGVAVAYFLFPAFNNVESSPDAWLRVYWVLAGLSMLSFVFLLFAKFEEGKEIPGVNLLDDVKQMILLMAKLLVIVFIISAFLYVMIEQGIMTWLPTFNKKVLQLPENVSIMMASILAVSLALGRFFAGFLVRYISWIWITVICIFAAMAMLVFVLPKAAMVEVSEINSITDIPLIGFAFPLVGIFIAPIYPLLNSTVLSALPKKLHSPMSGLIIVFSALGGSTGSVITGWLFKEVGAGKAFYFVVIPLFLLLIILFILRKLTRRKYQPVNA